MSKKGKMGYYECVLTTGVTVVPSGGQVIGQDVGVAPGVSVGFESYKF